MSRITSVADALVTSLIAAGFAEAERLPLPYVKREDCNARKCVVICRQQLAEDSTRGDYDQVAELSIVLQQAVSDPHDNTAVDALLDDVQTLWDLWAESGSLRHTTLAGAIYDGGPEHPTGTIYEFQQLLELNLFSSITVVRYRLEA